MGFRLSVDTGGTFTDVVIMDRAGNQTIGKALTTPERAFGGIREALEVAAAEIKMTLAELLAQSDMLIYGTTRATNAIVTRTVAKTAFLTTRGFPDTLVYKEGGRLNAHDFSRNFPEPYIPRRRTFEIAERMSSEGTVSVPFDETQARAVAERLRARGIEAVAVCFLWSIANPMHELRMAALLDELLPDVPYTLSHQLVPIVREYRRASATAIDASLKPLMQRHIRGLERDLRAEGYAGEILISTSVGGVMQVDEVVDAPIHTAKSGPAMAPIAGRTYSHMEQLGDNVIVCDTGGTTFDVGLVRDGRLVFNRDSWLGGQWTGNLLGVSSVDVRSIGAGGGSIAWIDDGGLMRVGPQSAGADPGPACYGRGGVLATVSDAACVLGYFDPEFFLGGRMRLDTAAAQRAIATVAAQTGRGIEQTAWDILNLASEGMIRAIHEITIAEGLNPQESTIVAGGGAAGMNIMTIARELGCERVILPKVASALSASGMQYADLVKEATASLPISSARFRYDEVNGVLEDLELRLQRFLTGLGPHAQGDHVIELLTEARYLGQVWELDTKLPVTRFRQPDDVAALIEAFHQVHERVFAVRDTSSPVECINWKARLTVRLAPEIPVSSGFVPRLDTAPVAKRNCFFGGSESIATPVYGPADLRPGRHIIGPAIVEEATTTLVVFPGMSARITEAGNYLLDIVSSERDPGGMSSTIDPVMTAVIANRIDGVVREMTTTLLRAGRSAVINSARDFSCAICTGDNELLACAEGLPIHIFGSHMQARTMVERHPDLAEGDAFLHNDPYSGNTHPADHTFLVPVYFAGEHLFTAVAKAHQADIGNSIPTTYHAAARDVYEEGSLIFPAVRIQRNYEMIDDIVQMCRSRIRVPNQWYGDFLAGLGAARTAERRLKELCAKYGVTVVKTFIRDWLNYSELRMTEALRKMPKATLRNNARHDPFEPLLPDGIPINVELEIDPEQGRIMVDLRNNIPNIDCGLNESEACTVSSVMAGIFNALPDDIPRNAGSFRRVSLQLKDGAVVGRPAFPHSCSVATTNVADRLVNCSGAAFAQLGDGYGLAEGGVGMGGSSAVISGKDHRYDNEPYVNQLILSSNGGPASPLADGWVTYGVPVCSGLMYRDSIEIDELKHPIEFTAARLLAGTGGAGKLRGAPASEIAFRPKEHAVTVIYPRDGEKYPAKGVVGGHDGQCGEGWHISANGQPTRLANVVHVEIKKHEVLRTVDCSGGGYGDPLARDPRRVLFDVLEGWETLERSRLVYGVVLVGEIEDESLAVDLAATQKLRSEMAAT